MKKIAAYIILLAVGFFVGRMTVTTTTEVKYVKGETVTNTVPVPEPYFVSTPDLPLFFYHTDTVTKTQVVDTAAIVADWILQRRYAQTLFDNESGKLDVDLSVQYNQLQGLSYTFTPIHKEITKYREKVWRPFVSASYSTVMGVGVGGGLFYHSIGLEYQMQRNDRDIGHLFSLKYKL